MSLRSVHIPLKTEGHMTMLSKLESDALLDASQSGLYETFRRCALAVLNTDGETDDTASILAAHRDFRIHLERRHGGVELQLVNPPPEAFVDGRIMQGIREHLYAVLRDILFVHHEVHDNPRYDLTDPTHVTSVVFHILRNAGALRPRAQCDLVVCWGGHSVSRAEYDYSKEVGYELGLRALDICTGCGPGAMKGPMKGAAIGHAKQRIQPGRYVGISEPGIIAAESPNPIVNELVIMPDIEKRLEAFLRLGHAFVLFPGGVGSAEELLYVLGVLLHPRNAAVPLPLILTGPAESRGYFEDLDRFIAATLGPAAQARYTIVPGDAGAVARRVKADLEHVTAHRQEADDATYFQWNLHVAPRFQIPFVPTHENLAALELSAALAPHALAESLRCAFSGIVAGNIKAAGMQAVEAGGPFQLRGSAAVIRPLARLLERFVAQRRMTLRSDVYTPCYELVETEPLPPGAEARRPPAERAPGAV